MLIRVLQIPPPTGRFHFGGGERQTFVELDWFRDFEGPGDMAPPGIETPEGRELIADLIRQKSYYRRDTAYLVLHPLHSFTIGYSAP